MSKRKSVANSMLIEKDGIVFKTDRMIAVVKNGVITRLFNRLTGTDYIVSPPESVREGFSSGMVYAVPKTGEEGKSPSIVGATPPPSRESEILVPTLVSFSELPIKERRKVGSQAVQYLFRSADAEVSLKLGYSLDLTSGDLLVQQDGQGKQTRLSGIRFGLGPVTCRGNLLLPALNGMKACRGDSLYKFESTIWGWPSGWQVPLVIFDDPLGGLWIHAQDSERRFKEVRYHYEGDGTWSVALDTSNHAPFDLHKSVESVSWRLNTYEGDWTVPVERYKRWAYDAYGFEEKERFRQRWVDEIRLVVKHADYMSDEAIVPFLDLLSKHVDPAGTLLFMTKWSDPTPVIPNWVAGPHGVRFNNETRKRGFRTMYFANYFGITPNHPRFNEFEPHFIRNPSAHEHEGWNLKGEWSEATEIKLYYVNPAYKPWRDYQIGQFKALFEEHFADGLFIDQTFVMFNDDNGLVDGQSTVEGNLAFHRELAEAIPDIAIGGEGINEITMQYESFCELHFLSLELQKDSDGNLNWRIDPAAFDRMVPLVPRLILPHTRPIGYLGFPDTSSSFYGGWRDALHIYGGIPTITRPRIDEIQDPESEVRRVLKRVFPEK